LCGQYSISLPEKEIAMKTRLLSRTTLVALLLATLLALPSPALAAPDKDIVDTAVAVGSFKTLAKALEAANLVEALKGEGPFTVFAPTDAAFAKLPADTIEKLLRPESRQRLQTILTYHVVGGRLTADRVVTAGKLDSLQGGSLLIGTTDGVTIDGAKVSKADIQCTNGVIHVIDDVMLPKDLVAKAETAGTFKTLLAAAKATGLADILKVPGVNFTVFAPTDEAFAKLPGGTVENLLKPANRTKLAAILLHHVAPQPILLQPRGSDTLRGDALKAKTKGPFTVGGATVLLPDVMATNGIIHVIDSVLLPDEDQATPRMRAIRVIQLAIARGVPIFNAGNAAGCAAIYEVAVRSLKDGHGGALSEASQKTLKAALTKIGTQTHDAEARAWTLRKAMDTVLGQLQRMQY
jgi:uncharacterized surface protein with fasciclin (FAS1) repeats